MCVKPGVTEEYFLAQYSLLYLTDVLFQSLAIIMVNFVFFFAMKGRNGHHYDVL